MEHVPTGSLHAEDARAPDTKDIGVFDSIMSDLRQKLVEHMHPGEGYEHAAYAAHATNGVSEVLNALHTHEQAYAEQMEQQTGKPALASVTEWLAGHVKSNDAEFASVIAKVQSRVDMARKMLPPYAQNPIALKAKIVEMQ